MGTLKHAYRIGEMVRFDQGTKSWHLRGEGTVHLCWESPQCLWYTLIRKDNGKMVEMLESDIQGKV